VHALQEYIFLGERCICRNMHMLMLFKKEQHPCYVLDVEARQEAGTHIYILFTLLNFILCLLWLLESLVLLV